MKNATKSKLESKCGINVLFIFQNLGIFPQKERTCDINIYIFSFA
jgi:hypothetical protein